MNAFEQRINETGDEKDLTSIDIETLQVNVGFMCNQSCSHCHIEASPYRKEMMGWDVMEKIIENIVSANINHIDITGGAPELNPNIERFISSLRGLGKHVQVRTNLTVCSEPGMEKFPEFYRDNKIHLVASLPCYTEENVDAQRGDSVYEKSVEVLKHLNSLGYGSNPELKLDLVYNPGGAVLPGEQKALEVDYKRELLERHGIVFSNLLTITNMPVGRFKSVLVTTNTYDEYLDLLKTSFNQNTVGNLMCRHQVSVGYEGTLYDCDFNLALSLPINHGAPNHIDAFDPAVLRERKIETNEHCFACTAGLGSSCSGALIGGCTPGSISG
ncbi:arsenosugar biosynthesis radical SAM (seleno)protein ArsS [Candidatus Latescibacterota bacterium]